MGVSDWNWRLPIDRQDTPWDCSATSLSWCLRAMGLEWSESEVVAGLGPSRISPTWGLLDASGAGIVDWLSTIGVAASNTASASWRDTMAAAGEQPMLIGGRQWCHWVAVRMGTRAAGIVQLDALALMNPAPGYMGIDQVLEETDYQLLGPFSAVWLEIQSL